MPAGGPQATSASRAPNTSRAILGSRNPAECELATACARHQAGLASAAAIVSITWLKVARSAAAPPSETGSKMWNRPASCIAASTSAGIRRSFSVRSAAASTMGASSRARATQSGLSSIGNVCSPRSVGFSLAQPGIHVGARAGLVPGARLPSRQNVRGRSTMRPITSGLIALAALLAVLPADNARAQDTYPSRVVRIVVPYPAGGGTDTLARLLADQLGRKWGQSAIVENVGGAAGNIGAAEVARAAPDGYTLLLTSPGPIATNSFLYKDMGYDPARWVPIALLATGPYVLVLRKSFEGSTVKELIARAKANPGKITSATPGIGSVGHLSTVQLEMLAGIKTVQVPYRGLGQAINDIIAGHVDFMFDTPTTSLPLHRDGKVKIVAVGTSERVRELPEVPTVAEAGLPSYRAVTWYAMVAPPQTPAALADRINRDLVDILGHLDVAEKVRGIQMEPVTRTRAEAAKFFAEETELWGKVIKEANIPMQ